MRILITGAGGLLGRTLAQHLTSHDLVLIDANTADLRDLDTASQITQGVDAVVHLAPISAHVNNDASDEESLDCATRGTVHLLHAAANNGVPRAIVASAMALFESLPEHYAVDEGWRPRPTAQLSDLCAWLAELSTREVARSTRMDAICLRLGEIVDDAMIAGKPFDPRWLHVDDAVAAIQRALEIETTGWQIAHIISADVRSRFSQAMAQDAPFNFQPRHDFSAHIERATRLMPTTTLVMPRAIRAVVIFGAGGPLASVLRRELEADYTLRLADVASIEDLLVNAKPQTPGAPLPYAVRPPHEWRVVDVRDAAQVMTACDGADAIINCSVLRNDPHDAFRVNCIGAYNVMRAAVAHGIQRVVHTGPFMLGARDRTGYDWDHWIVDDVPPRPGLSWLYFISKYQGQEIVRIFAEQFGLVVPALTFNEFVDPNIKRLTHLTSLSISWADAARALRCALEVPSLPTPFEYFHIGADVPHGVFSNEKAKRLLKWQPTDDLALHYRR